MLKQPAPLDDGRIRSGFVTVLAGVLALILIPLWIIFGHRVWPVNDIKEGSADMEAGPWTVSNSSGGKSEPSAETVAAVASSSSSEQTAIAQTVTAVDPHGPDNGEAGIHVTGSRLAPANAPAEMNDRFARPEKAGIVPSDGGNTPPARELSHAGEAQRHNAPASGGEPSRPGKTAVASEPGLSDAPGAVEGKWGIRLSGMELAKANGAVEMTYQVTGYEQVTALLSRNNSDSHLIDLASGTEITLSPSQAKEWPFAPHSSARSMALAMREAGTFPPPPNRLVAGKTYKILIPNPDGLIKSGSSVVVVVGGVRSEALTVK